MGRLGGMAESLESSKSRALTGRGQGEGAISESGRSQSFREDT